MDAELYIKDFVYGANDGIITTFAIVAGVAGAELSSSIILIIGVASLFADGFSMASSNYLGSTSEQDAVSHNGAFKRFISRSYKIKPARSALYTFIAFIAAGVIPLLPYFFISGNEKNRFSYTIVSTLFALFLVGSLRSFVTKRSFVISGFEMIVVGGAAAGMAYLIGQLISGMV